MNLRFCLYLIFTLVNFASSDNLFLTTKNQPLTAGSCPSEHPLMVWEITSLNKPIYLMGTIHFGNSTMYPLDPQIIEAITSSDILVSEIEISPEAKAQAAMAMQSSIMIQDPNQSLQKMIADSTYKQLGAKAQGLGLPLSALNRMQPWAIGMTLTVMQIKTLGIHEEEGIENQVLKIFGTEKPNQGLESPQSHVQIFSQLEDHDGFLQASLKSQTDIVQEMNAMLNAWKCGDNSRMEKILIEDAFNEINDTKFLRALMQDRNHHMTQAIIKDYIKPEKSAFIMVGGAHFFGEEGILTLLRQEGYELRQLEAIDR